MVNTLKEVEGRLNIKVLDLDGNVIHETNEKNFMTETFRKMLIQNGLGGFIGSLSVAPNCPSYCTSSLTDKAIKFALAITDNGKVYDDGGKKKLRDVEGNIIEVTKGVRDMADREESFIRSINFLPEGGIEIVAVIGSGCEGTVRGVDLCIPSDMDFNSSNILSTVSTVEELGNEGVSTLELSDDSALRGMLYRGPIGEHLVTSLNKSTDYFNTRFVEWKNHIIWGFTNSSTVYICKYNMSTKEITYKSIAPLKSSLYTAKPQVINDELYFFTCAENVYVLDIDFNEVRKEATTRTISQTVTTGYCELTQTFICDGYVYNIDYLNTSSKYFKYSRTPLVSSGKSDYVAPKTINFSDIDALKKILYGVWIEGTTTIQSLDGDIYDLVDLEGITNADNWVSKGSMEYDAPIGLMKPFKMSNGVWIGVHMSSHEFNKYSGLYTTNALPLHFCNNIAFPSLNKYVTMLTGGNCLTHITLSSPIEKTTSNELVLTYVLK